MTLNQLSAVLDWKYPTIGKAWSVKAGVLVFSVWLDRATGQASSEPKPTLAQCEAWLPDLPPPAKSQRELDCEAARKAIDAALADWSATTGKAALAAIKKVL